MPSSASSHASSVEDFELQTPLLKQEDYTAARESDQEQDDPVVPNTPSRGAYMPSRRNILLVVALVVAVAIVGGTAGGLAKSDPKAKRYFGPPPTDFAVRRVTPGPAELLTSAAPARSYKQALRPDLRYVTADSFNGWTGHVLAAFSLIYLAQVTQRVAILPSFQDHFHYGYSMIQLDLLFDMERFRQERGALFVNWADVKPLDGSHEHTDWDEIGCYRGPNQFEGGTSFANHSLDRSIWHLSRPSQFPNSLEAMILWDLDESVRLARTAAFAEQYKYTQPANLLGSQLLCYGNIWSMAPASALARGWNYFGGTKPGQQQSEYGGMSGVLDPAKSGMWPEWFEVGQYIDFTPKVWEIALSCVKRTLRAKRVPKNLITVHLRRGDFKIWCPTQHDCVPAIDRYAQPVNELLQDSPADTIVLVTTDEKDDQEFLSSVDQLGWFRIDHGALGTADVLRAEYGDTALWADAAIDQAILSLGMHFVGTSDSQVSIISELRVATWNGGKTRLVKRPSHRQR